MPVPVDPLATNAPDPHAPPVDTVTLERIAMGAWVPEELVELDGWWLRASGGFTGRGNSALALSEPPDVDARLDVVVAWYRERDLPAWVAVPSPVLAGLHERLVTRGWRVHHGGRVMVRDLSGLPSRPGSAEVVIRPAPAPSWLARYRYRGGALPEVGRRMLARGDVVGHAAIHDGADVVAIGRGVVVEGWLGVNAVETAPERRRRGLAGDVLAALATWARGHGATATFLQVDLANDVAHTVYRRAGYLDHHTYCYLQAPQP